MCRSINQTQAWEGECENWGYLLGLGPVLLLALAGQGQLLHHALVLPLAGLCLHLQAL